MPTHLARLVVCFMPLAVLTAVTTQAQAPVTAPLVERLRLDIEVLAADSLGGRYTPSPGLALAVHYASTQLASAGWLAAGDSGAFEQRWRSAFTRIDWRAASLRVAACASSAIVPVGRDLIVMQAGESEVRGYPIPLDSMNGPTRVDVRGKFVVLHADTNPSGIAHRAMGHARSAGAAGVIVVVPDDFAGMATPRLANQLAEMDHTSFGVATAIITRRRWSDLARAMDVCPASVLEWRGPTQTDSGTVANVVAILPGNDPNLKGEYVVLSAHIDHVGEGMPDSSNDHIYNGADDNASGVAVVLEVARALGRDRPRRSVIILLPSGEEQGMRGSAWFMTTPPVGRDRIIANVNVDGVGRAWQKDTLSAVGSAYSTLGPIVADVARAQPDLQLTVVADQWPGLRYFEFSDQISFARKGIPSIFFSSTGPDSHYHQPSDEPDTIDYGHLARVTELVHRTVRAIADMPGKPAWEPGARARIVQDPS